MRFRIGSAFALAVACAAIATPPASAGAQVAPTSRDSAHFYTPKVKASRDSVWQYLRQTKTPGYAKRGAAIWYAAETLLVNPLLPPQPPAAQVPHAVLISGATTVEAGRSIQLTARVIDSVGNVMALPVVWGTSTPDVGSVSSSGLYTGTKAGTGIVTASTPSAPGATRQTSIAVTPSPAPLPPVDTASPPLPPPGTIAGATVATLPLKTPITPYPMGGNVIKLAAGADLQAALSRARSGDVIALSPCATWVGNFTLPNRADTGWVVIRTDVSDAAIGAEGTRMTPTRAGSACLAKIQTAIGGASAAIGTAPGAHGWRLTGLELGETPAAVNLNTIVRFGESGGNGQTTIASQPYNLVIDRSYVHGGTTQNVRRCIIMNSGSTEIVDSWLGDCHDSGGDSQGTLAYNGTGPHRIENNHIESGHQCFMSGGADPANSGFIPSDITFRRNHCTRPVAWLTLPNGAGGWQTKTIIESKCLRRMLIEGNVIENVRADAQAGFAFLLKSTNQDGTAPYCITSDVTVRWNVVRNMGSGVNLAANPQGGIPATRFFFTDNSFDGCNVAPFKGDGITRQYLGNLSDVIFEHNTFSNCNVTATSVSFDGGQVARLVDRSNIFPHGPYGVKGSGTADGSGTLAAYAPGAVFTFNAIFAGGGNCSQYPATNVCPLTAPATPGLGADGRPIGADMARIAQMTAGVEVAP